MDLLYFFGKPQISSKWRRSKGIGEFQIYFILSQSHPKPLLEMAIVPVLYVYLYICIFLKYRTYVGGSCTSCTLIGIHLKLHFQLCFFGFVKAHQFFWKNCGWINLFNILIWTFFKKDCGWDKKIPAQLWHTLSFKLQKKRIFYC